MGLQDDGPRDFAGKAHEGPGHGRPADGRVSLGQWIREFARGRKPAPPRVGDQTGEYLFVAGNIFRYDAGGHIPEDCGEFTAMVNRSGARVEGRRDAPPGWRGAMLGDQIYIDMGLPLPARRRVVMQLWARFLCWRDRGGQPAAVYQDEPAPDPSSRVADLFTRIAQEADPVQPKREPTLY